MTEVDRTLTRGKANIVCRYFLYYKKLGSNNMKGHAMQTSIYDFTVKSAAGKEVSLAQYRGKHLLIVNTASLCGFTPQYEDLENVYQQYKDKGLEILAFPCNQFNGQEPGTDAQIADFCATNFHISFPVFAKIAVNGSTAHPLYAYLSEALPGLLGSKAIKWNFTKFFIDKNGVPIKRFAPQEKPAAIMRELSPYFS